MSLIQHQALSNKRTIALYKRKSGDVISYEVQVLNLIKSPLFLKRSDSRGDYDMIWKHPSNENFGLYGWAYKRREDADKKYSEILSRYEVKE